MTDKQVEAVCDWVFKKFEAARGHLDGLVNLAHRNGLDLKPLIQEKPGAVPLRISAPAAGPLHNK